MSNPPAASTVSVMFSTNAAAGAAVAPSSAFEAADIQVYKNTSNTPRSSTSGWTMTSPVNSVVGLHRIAMDTSDNTDAGFWAAGSKYFVVLNPDETIDSQTPITSIVGEFTLGYDQVDVVAWNGTAVSTPATAGIPEVNVKNINNVAAATPGAAGGLFIAGSNAATSITTALTANIIGNVTGNLSGSVGSVTGAVGSVTGAVGSVTGNVGGNVGGNVTGSVGSVVTKTGFELSATGLDLVVMSDISAVPSQTGTLKAAINWLFCLARNKRTQTSTTETLFKDDGSTQVATSTKSDTAGTFTRGEYS